MDIHFRIDGEPLQLSSGQVIESVQDIEPEPIRLHSVNVSGTWYPLKQVFALATGLDRLDFTTNQARTQLKRLGFEVKRTQDEQ